MAPGNALGTPMPLVPEVVFHSTGTPGYSAAVQGHPGAIPARKRERIVQARFAAQDCLVHTPEGDVYARAGDAIVTGSAGEVWPVPLRSFENAYRPVSPTVMGMAGAYRCLPNPVLAVRMDRTFAVVLADGRSQLAGGAGDWMVDYGDGTLGAIADAIFLTTYETQP
jgi:hypothetical protein